MKKYLFMILIFLISTSAQSKNFKKVYFAGGCFWCMEESFENILGVSKVISGYSGGTTENPTYKEVTSGKTNHAEVVNIEYDPSKVSYTELLEIFWRTHDPTTLNRQGADVGTQYRSIILYHDSEQKELSEKIMKELDNAGSWDSPIVTQIEKFEKFYTAENYHQDYYKLNPNNGYCAYVIAPKIDKFKKVFNKYLKN